MLREIALSAISNVRGAMIFKQNDKARGGFHLRQTEMYDAEAFLTKTSKSKEIALRAQLKSSWRLCGNHKFKVGRVSCTMTKAVFQLGKYVADSE